MPLARRALILAVLVLFFAPPLFASAIGLPYFGVNTPGPNGLLSCSGTGGGGLPMCSSVCDILVTGQRILYFAITIALFVIAPLMLAWGGILWLTSSGSEERISQGRSVLRATAIGIAIILGAFIIVNTFFYLTGKFAPSVADIKWSSIQCTVPAAATTATPSNPTNTQSATVYSCTKAGKIVGCYETQGECNPCASAGGQCKEVPREQCHTSSGEW